MMATNYLDPKYLGMIVPGAPVSNVSMANNLVAKTASGAGSTGTSLAGNLGAKTQNGLDPTYAGMIVPGGESSQTTGTTQTPAYPTNLDFNLPAVETMSWDEALERARKMYEPKYNLARQRTDKLYADQRAQLPQLLAARGYLKGGKREAGENNITQEQAMSLTDLDNQYASGINQLASDIYSGESTGGTRKMQDLITLQNQKNQAAIQKWLTDYNAWNQDSSDYNNLFLKALGLYLQDDVE